ncbi:MAG: DUF6557 family protein [Bacteroidales bacterium]
MTLAELIKSHSWLSVKLTLEKMFPDQDDLWDDYEKVFYDLQTMRVAPLLREYTDYQLHSFL